MRDGFFFSAHETERSARGAVRESTRMMDHTQSKQQTRDGRKAVDIRFTAISVILFAVAASFFVHSLFGYLAASARFAAPTLDATNTLVEVELAEIVHADLDLVSTPDFTLTEPAFDPIVEPAILTEIETDIPLPESELAAFDISDLGELGSSDRKSVV